ncbi:uncharacterized protein H6S33_001890 [Morchella sextelata]|uniref:uncharacterized protein n=1 Tax=Morchella sextelata TaxID=1174677 RepID=UPI001D03F2DC|nr:uncharacterized protein H6S33_001890 [Morchella sextelata]KAH0608756.1 hypothetical protein H6S33_001890 [Morchella sextelata]
MPRLKGKKWEEREKLIEKAMTHYRESGNSASLRISAETFGISWSTLRDRLNGEQNRREANRTQQLLNEDEEGCIVRWCQRMDDWGFPLRLSLVKELAAYLVSKRKGPGHKLGQHWLGRFLDRNPELSSRFSGRLDRQRAVTNNQELLRDFYKKLKEVTAKYDVLPKDTYNMDEKGFMIGMCAKVKVICRAGRKNPHLTHSGNRKWVTVIEAVSGTGVALPPMIINQDEAMEQSGVDTGINKGTFLK